MPVLLSHFRWRSWSIRCFADTPTCIGTNACSIDSRRRGRPGRSSCWPSSCSPCGSYRNWSALWQGYLKIVIGYNGHGIKRPSGVRSDLYRQLQSLSIAYHRSRPQGDAIYRISYDTYGVLNAFNVIQTIFVNSIILACLSVIMLCMNWKLGLITAVVRDAGAFCDDQVLRQDFDGHRDESRPARYRSDLHRLRRSVSAISLVQSYLAASGTNIDRFHDSVHVSNYAWIRMHTQSLIYWLAIGGAFGFAAAIIFGVGGYMSFRNPLGFTVGDLWIFLQYTLINLYDPLHKLSGSGADMRKNLAGMQRVYEVLDTPLDIKDAPDAISIPVRAARAGDGRTLLLRMAMAADSNRPS